MLELDHKEGRILRKSMWLLVLCGAVSLVVAAFAPAAEIYTFKASLGPKGEVPAARAPVAAKGSFSGTLKGNSLRWRLSYSGLSGPATAAHIHAGKRGVGGPVIVPLCGPCKSGASGTARLSESVEKTVESGGAYVNVHTGKNAGGEIRGQIAAKG
jgi:hypothetical protein